VSAAQAIGLIVVLVFLLLVWFAQEREWEHGSDARREVRP
jgi:hypothetical protein